MQLTYIRQAYCLYSLPIVQCMLFSVTSNLISILIYACNASQNHYSMSSKICVNLKPNLLITELTVPV